MITVRRSEDRGRGGADWLDSRHTFSFADYHDPAHMGFGVLRVLNEDRVRAGAGFGSHPHRDMEIISYVLDGALRHQDSMGNVALIRPGEVQRMSAGSGVVHSERNESTTAPVHFLQIWIVPERRGGDPGYAQRAFAPAELQDRLRVVVSRDGRDGSVTIGQDVALYVAMLSPGARVEHSLDAGRRAWLQVARGSVEMNGQRLATGDGAAISEERSLALDAANPAEVLLFDLP